ncbi:hypothetical protein T484DRAFT_2407707 [Baffinella frigidus]|nr:hypothetical protein T484DRAFT_2407707 [Cryptophyta sp. CCMP2293]
MDPLGDGDQSLLRAVFPSGHTPESTALHVLWSNLGDFSKDGKMNVFGIARAAYWGDAAYIEGAIAWVRAGCPANELFPYHSDLYGAPKRLGSLTELLEGRHTNLRMTPLHFAILGAKRPADAQASIPHDWLKCAAVLIKAGARVDSRDLMGNTPMMGALAVPVQNADTIAIALHLAKNGATGLDLNRLGMNTLMSAVEKQAIDVIHVLAEADCDPRQANHWGQSSLQLAQMMQKLEMGASAGAILQVLEAASERRAKKGKSSSLSGRAVALKGLSDSNLNGQKGTVSALVNATQGRYGVTLSGGRELAVKWQNLEPLAEGASKGDDLLGKLVVLQGLSTAALNGRRGTCQEWVEDAGRWVVALEDDGAAGGEAGKVVRVRPQNLRAVLNPKP